MGELVYGYGHKKDNNHTPRYNIKKERSNMSDVEVSHELHSGIKGWYDIHTNAEVSNFSDSFWSKLKNIVGIEKIYDRDNRYEFRIIIGDKFSISPIFKEVKKLICAYSKDRFGREYDPYEEESIISMFDNTDGRKNTSKEPKKIYALIRNGVVRQITSIRSEIDDDNLDESDMIMHITKVEDALLSVRDGKLSDFFKKEGKEDLCSED